MKAVVFVSSIVALLTFSEADGQPEGEIVSGFQCVGINIKGLQLSQDDLRTGAKFPLNSRCAKGQRETGKTNLYHNLHCVAARHRKRICEGNEL